MSSPFQEVTFDNKKFTIMRDDLSHPIFSGNKARKLAYILKAPEKYSHIKTIVSFGGNQSNFMLALSQLAKLMNWKFEYWIKPLPKFLNENKIGNLNSALKNDMTLRQTTDSLNLTSIQNKYINTENTYFFDQGGRDVNTKIGLADCANEIKDYCQKNNLDNYSVVVASGRGTTALYLEKYLPNKIYTISCVDCDDYLINQLISITKTLKHPQILGKSFKSNFGKLDIENYHIYHKLLEQTGIEFELLYDPIAWRVLLENHDNLPKPIIYMHCGGTSGNVTMLARYRRLLS